LYYISLILSPYGHASSCYCSPFSQKNKISLWYLHLLHCGYSSSSSTRLHESYAFHLTAFVLLHQSLLSSYQDCQSQSWKSQHKYECKIFKNLYPKVLPNTVRMAIQLLLRRKAKSLPDNQWQEFVDLQSHIDDFKAQQTRNDENLTIWQTIELMSQAILSYSRIYEPLDTVQGIVARVSSSPSVHRILSA